MVANQLGDNGKGIVPDEETYQRKTISPNTKTTIKEL